jgi:F0F1-type ATP synthase assembly protein I
MPGDRQGSPQRGPSGSEPPGSRQSAYAQAGMAMLIPSLMVAGPLVGYAVGYFIRRGTGWGRWVEIVMALLGLAAGIRESVIVIRKISR